MKTGRICKFSELNEYLAKSSERRGCFVDTSVLFSGTYPLDIYNEDCERVFELLADIGVSIYTNVNVRSEFLEGHRRALIAECLIDILEERGSDFGGALLEKLKAHRTSYRRRLKEEKSAKMDIGKIKMFRRLLAQHKSKHGNGWELFCRDYLLNKLAPIWEQTEKELGLNSISLREGDHKPYLSEIPDWTRTIHLMGAYGIGSNDAMIVNIFLCSNFPFLLTADIEMADCIVRESRGKKQVFVPDATNRDDW